MVQILLIFTAIHRRGNRRGHFVPLHPPTGRVPVPGMRSASNAARSMLRLRHSGGSAGFRRAQNTAPSGVPSRFFAGRQHSLRLFLQEVGGQGARPLPGYVVGLLVWRSIQGLGRPLCMTGRTTREVPGRLARVPLFGSCMACGLVRGSRLALAGPWACMTHEIEPAADGQEPFKWLYPIYKVA